MNSSSKPLKLRNESPSQQSNSSSNYQQPTILQQQKFLARVHPPNSKDGPSSEKGGQDSITLVQVSPQQNLSTTQTDRLLAQNQEFSAVIKNLHGTVRSLTLQLESMQSGYEKRFQFLANQNMELEQRLTQNEAKLKKVSTSTHLTIFIVSISSNLSN